MTGPSLPKIADVFATMMLAEVNRWNNIGYPPENRPAPPDYDAVFVPENRTSPTPARGWVVLSRTKFGQTTAEELGDESALSQRVGVFICTISIPQNQETTQALRFSGIVEAVFRRKELDGCIICGEPYTEDVGPTADQRYSITVFVPWVTHYSTEV